MNQNGTVDRAQITVVELEKSVHEYWRLRSVAGQLQAIEIMKARFMPIPQLPDDFKEFLRVLNSNGVEYLFVGGYAVGFHGYYGHLECRPTQ